MSNEEDRDKMDNKPTSSEDSNDSSAVMVDHTDVADEPQALQIVSIGTKENAYAFTFHQDKLKIIMDRLPPETKVAVVSVVGAFRTGKSFLLCWFLRYLHYLQHQECGKADDGKKWYEQVENLGKDGFDWKAGSERNTTGIWMWSHPHLLKKQKLAVLLVDTQGMFDHETTMALTASIFGLSTLLSSYQIYNIDKMIQEDNLQQLALFSEYARAAMATEKEKDSEKKPFQQVEFLVRDWQHFEEDEDFEAMAKEMEDHLDKVMATRDAKDLQETREQISVCFEKVSCYGFTHPGFAVTKKNYGGEVDKIDPTFLGLLDRYCSRVFDRLKPKVIHGRELTGEELAAYVESYAKLFESGASFPEAATMLEATAAANNTNAINLAINRYKEAMNKIAGPNCSNYIRSEELLEEHKMTVTRSLDVFNSIANFGSQKSIEKSKRNLMEKIESDFEVYSKLNDQRNPLLGLEVYIIPLGVAAAAYFIRLLTDWTCAPWSQICKSSSMVLTEVYMVVISFLLIIAATKYKQIKDFTKKMLAMLETMNSGPKAGTANPGLRGAKAKAE